MEKKSWHCPTTSRLISLVLLLVAAHHSSAAGVDLTTNYIEKYCHESVTGFPTTYDKTTKRCKVTFTLETNGEEPMKACSKMAPFRAVQATGSDGQDTVCTYAQVVSCGRSKESNTIMVDSTCIVDVFESMNLGHRDTTPLTFNAAVDHCEKFVLNGQILANSKHYFKWISHYFPYKSFWYGSSSSENGTEYGNVVYTGIRMMSPIRPGYTEKRPVTEKHNILCMYPGDKTAEVAKQDMAVAAEWFGGIMSKDGDRFYMATRGVHLPTVMDASNNPYLNASSLHAACGEVIPGVTATAAVPVTDNKDEMNEIAVTFSSDQANPKAFTVPGSRSKVNQQDCRAAKYAGNAFQLQTAENLIGKVSTPWKTGGYPMNECADGPNSLLAFTTEGLIDQPFFVRNRIICQYGVPFAPPGVQPADKCDPNYRNLYDPKTGQCACGPRTYTSKESAFPGQICKKCKDADVYVVLIMDNSFALGAYQYGLTFEAVKKIAPAFNSDKISIVLMKYDAAGGKTSVIQGNSQLDSKLQERRRWAWDWEHRIGVAKDHILSIKKGTSAKHFFAILVTSHEGFDMDCVDIDGNHQGCNGLKYFDHSFINCWWDKNKCKKPALIDMDITGNELRREGIRTLLIYGGPYVEKFETFTKNVYDIYQIDRADSKKDLERFISKFTEEICPRI